MRVIRKGALPEKRVYKGVCNHCGTIVEFAQEEARYVSDQRDGDALVVTCPTCGKEIWSSARRNIDFPFPTHE
jgi:RNase P subunit RPR2